MNHHFLEKFSKEVEVLDVVIDSRKVREGSFFVALKGEHHDGHDYLQEVASRGAVAALVTKSYRGSDFGMLLVRAEDTLKELQSYARKALEAMQCQVVAVTGSVGKTTTKEFISTLASGAFLTKGTPGNANSQVGLPLAILNDFTGEEEVVVLEMGMSESGNISGLIDIAPPDIALITAVELVHACNFQELADIARAKAEILSHPKTAIGVINRDITHFDEIQRVGNAKKISYSINQNADYTMSFDSTHIYIVENGKSHSLVRPPIEERHNFQNVLAAIIAVRKLGLNWEQIENALPRLRLPEGRMQQHLKNGVLFINDAYNACEVSVKAALDSMPSGEGRKIAVLGSMLELGRFSESCHQRVGEYAFDRVDYLLCYGKECSSMVEFWKDKGKQASLFEDREQLIVEMQKLIAPGDVVLLKGSRAKELSKLVDEVTI